MSFQRHPSVAHFSPNINYLEFLFAKSSSISGTISSGFVLGPYLFIGFPSWSTKNLAKFHLREKKHGKHENNHFKHVGCYHFIEDLPNVFCTIFRWQLVFQKRIYLTCILTIHLTLFKPNKFILRSKVGLHEVKDFFMSPLYFYVRKNVSTRDNVQTIKQCQKITATIITLFCDLFTNTYRLLGTKLVARKSQNLEPLRIVSIV